MLRPTGLCDGDRTVASTGRANSTRLEALLDQHLSQFKAACAGLNGGAADETGLDTFPVQSPRRKLLRTCVVTPGAYPGAAG